MYLNRHSRGAWWRSGLECSPCKRKVGCSNPSRDRPIKLLKQVVTAPPPNAWQYCGIILIHGGQWLWIVKILPVRGDVISWVTGFRHYNARQFITSLNVCGDVNSWVRVTHEIHEHQSPTKNNDSTVGISVTGPRR